jgi:hypothetical protein
MEMIEFGPARVILSATRMLPKDRNEVVLVPKGDALEYEIHTKQGRVRKKGIAKQGDTVETGWMGLKFRILRFLPRARETVSYVASSSASPLATPAIRVEFRGAEHWVGLNNVLRLYFEDKAYLVSYGNRQLDLGFPVKLEAFRMGTYEGTERAASYESDVTVPGIGQHLISMNEPLKHNGYTLYQSSFERDEMGKPVVSVFSVNYDPGRWVKYLGSFLIVLGSVILFYFKRTKWLELGSKK